MRRLNYQGRALANWRTLELHTDPPSALVQMSALQAAGLFAFIDNYYYASIVPYRALALGGFRVVVADEDWETATEFSACADVADLDGFEPIDLCPNCGSREVFRGASWILSILGFLWCGVPLPRETSYRKSRRCASHWRKSPAAS